MRISQCKLNNMEEIATRGFMKRYSLKKYKDRNSPAIFYGLGGSRDLQRHNSMAVVIWRGSDIVKFKSKRKFKFLKKKNVYNIAISSFIVKDIEGSGVRFKFIPIASTDFSIFNPCKLGNEIYTYVPCKSNEKHIKRYGLKIINKIIKNVEYKVNIISYENRCSQKQLVKIYERCFCGLRLTKHDGLPNQVVEMALMGRRSIYNGELPGSIKWRDKNFENIIYNINKEAKKIGTTNYKLSYDMRKYLDVGDSWMNTKFWKKDN